MKVNNLKLKLEADGDFKLAFDKFISIMSGGMVDSEICFSNGKDTDLCKNILRVPEALPYLNETLTRGDSVTAKGTFGEINIKATLSGNIGDLSTMRWGNFIKSRFSIFFFLKFFYRSLLNFL